MRRTVALGSILPADARIFFVGYASPGLQQQLDGIREVFLSHVMIATLDPQQMGLHQHICIAKSFGGFELVASDFDLETIWVLKIDRIHEPTVALQKLYPPFAQSRRNLREAGP